MLYCFHAGQVSKKRIAKEEKEKKKRLNNYLSTLFHSRVRGGLRLNRTLGLRGDSNHSAQRLAEPRRSALALIAFPYLICFARDFFELNGRWDSGGLPF